jgi:hypothetical protein
MLRKEKTEAAIFWRLQLSAQELVNVRAHYADREVN